MLVLWDADAGILNGDRGGMLAPFQAERHRAWSWGVLESVVEENVSHAPEQVFVAGYPCVGVRQVCRKAEVANSGDLFPRLGNSLQHGGEINGLQLQRFPSQVGSGHRQELLAHGYPSASRGSWPARGADRHSQPL